MKMGNISDITNIIFDIKYLRDIIHNHKPILKGRLNGNISGKKYEVPKSAQEETEKLTRSIATKDSENP